MSAGHNAGEQELSDPMQLCAILSAAHDNLKESFTERTISRIGEVVKVAHTAHRLARKAGRGGDKAWKLLSDHLSLVSNTKPPPECADAFREALVVASRQQTLMDPSSTSATAGWEKEALADPQSARLVQSQPHNTVLEEEQSLHKKLQTQQQSELSLSGPNDVSSNSSSHQHDSTVGETAGLGDGRAVQAAEAAAPSVRSQEHEAEGEPHTATILQAGHARPGHPSLPYLLASLLPRRCTA